MEQEPFVLPESAPAIKDFSEAPGWDFSGSGEVGLALHSELIPFDFLFL